MKLQKIQRKMTKQRIIFICIKKNKVFFQNDKLLNSLTSKNITKALVQNLALKKTGLHFNFLKCINTLDNPTKTHFWLLLDHELHGKNMVPNKKQVSISKKSSLKPALKSLSFFKDQCADVWEKIQLYFDSPRIITISGTPGTGKTTLSKKLSLLLHYKIIDVKKVIKKHGLDTEYDKKRKTAIIDIRKLNTILIAMIKKTKHSLIIDSHLSHELPSKYVDLCIITRCSDLKGLEQRLKKRRYNALKTRENLESEVFMVCLIDAYEKGHNVISLDTTAKTDIKSLISRYNLILK